MKIHNATLRRHASPGAKGYQYDVVYQGQVIVTSHDPELQLAGNCSGGG